ncbi:MAG: hypothetical protein GY934_06030 [Gammaproteobacteria bacterium]|nr:hypothetical protein [Gammaproteobacteria bacterium]
MIRTPDFLLLILSLVLIATSASASEDSRFELPGTHFSLQPPVGWDSGQIGVDRYAFALDTPSELMPNFNLSVQAPPPGPSVQERLDELRRTLSEQVEIELHGITIVDGQTAGMIRVSTEISGLSVVNLQLFIPVGDLLYSLSFMTLKNEWPQYEVLFDTVIRSINID